MKLTSTGLDEVERAVAAYRIHLHEALERDAEERDLDRIRREDVLGFLLKHGTIEVRPKQDPQD